MQTMAFSEKTIWFGKLWCLSPQCSDYFWGHIGILHCFLAGRLQTVIEQTVSRSLTIFFRLYGLHWWNTELNNLCVVLPNKKSPANKRKFITCIESGWLGNDWMKISGHYYCGSCTLVFVEFCCSHACPFYKALFFLSNRASGCGNIAGCLY